ncbi:hypothetical protein B0A50_04579 [Salinomyces thailandicus]|uniref:Secreted protein n=1 Tax=Salinomyces thailandicus TaxID=706561 RepID=A0A4U0TUR4_9PEZI|nr:hypothetical protein B0A50_04579 [Salinomyces thailandica]
MRAVWIFAGVCVGACLVLTVSVKDDGGAGGDPPAAAVSDADQPAKREDKTELAPQELPASCTAPSQAHLLNRPDGNTLELPSPWYTPMHSGQVTPAMTPALESRRRPSV